MEELFFGFPKAVKSGIFFIRSSVILVRTEKISLIFASHGSICPPRPNKINVNWNNFGNHLLSLSFFWLHLPAWGFWKVFLQTWMELNKAALKVHYHSKLGIEAKLWSWGAEPGWDWPGPYPILETGIRICIRALKKKSEFGPNPRILVIVLY